jgi:hypothetical protein
MESPLAQANVSCGLLEGMMQKGSREIFDCRDVEEVSQSSTPNLPQFS